MEDARKEADAANATKSEFLAHMSHEIRTPLNAILGFAELLKGSEGAEIDKNLYLETILRNGRALSGLIDDILDLAKVEAKKIDIQPTVTDYCAVLDEVEQTLAFQAASKGLRIRHEYLGKLPQSIVSDPTRLRQILMNVVGNAVKFAETGEILIAVASEVTLGQPDRLRFSVKDQGPGMTQEQQRHLFQPFTQADGSISRRYGGTGLGLVLSSQLSRLLGGDLSLASSKPGEGSTFVIRVAVEMDGRRSPSSAVTNRAAVNSELNPGRDSLQGRRVLVADDNLDNRTLIKAILSPRGVIVDFAVDGLEALAKALTAEYDIVLMDIQMPRCDGLEATRVLRRRGYSKPIIALTAHAMKEEQERSLAAGCSSHLSKPVSRDDLIGVIAHA